MSSLANTIWLLVGREFRRMIKEPSRMMGMLAQPLLFLGVFGAGFHESFFWSDSPDASYAQFFFPGVLALVVLFSSIYATLTLVDDKKCGLFRLVLVSPTGLLGAIAGKVVATAILGFGQSLLFLPLMLVLGLALSTLAVGQLLVLLALGSLCCALLGVLLAWISPSPSAFHALMSVLLLPMWLLSGAMFPVKDTIFAYLSLINPMSYLVAGLRGVLLNNSFTVSTVIALLVFSFLITMLLVRAIAKAPLE